MLWLPRLQVQWHAQLRPGIKTFNLDVLSDFPQNKQVLAWVDTSMVHVPHWPVGPEAADKDLDNGEAALHYIPSDLDTLDTACTDSGWSAMPSSLKPT